MLHLTLESLACAPERSKDQVLGGLDQFRPDQLRETAGGSAVFSRHLACRPRLHRQFFFMPLCAWKPDTRVSGFHSRRDRSRAAVAHGCRQFDMQFDPISCAPAAPRQHRMLCRTISSSARERGPRRRRRRPPRRVELAHEIRRVGAKVPIVSSLHQRDGAASACTCRGRRKRR